MQQQQAGAVTVVSGYSPTVTTLPQGGGVVNITGQYPFSDRATIVVSKPTQLSLRIPCFASGATVTVSSSSSRRRRSSGQSSGVPMKAPPCAFFPVHVVEADTTVTIDFEMPITLHR